MVSLSTVNPNRLGVVHRDGESGEVGNAITNRFAGRKKKLDRRASTPRMITHYPELKPLINGLQGSLKVD